MMPCQGSCRPCMIALPSTPRDFSKHGIDNIAYWVDEVGISNRLTYMLGYPDLGAREKAGQRLRPTRPGNRPESKSEKDGTSCG